MSIKKYTQAEIHFTSLITFIIFKKLLGATHDKANRLVAVAYSIRKSSGNKKCSNSHFEKRRWTLSAETAGISFYVKRVWNPLYVKMRIAVKNGLTFLNQ